MTKTTSLSLTYLHTYGVHQMVTRDCECVSARDYVFNSDGTTTIKDRVQIRTWVLCRSTTPKAIFKQNQLIVNINARITPKFNVSGFYNLTSANSNTGTASNSYNLMQDYRPRRFA